MGQPVKLSDELVDDARAVVPFSQRSIAGQIEFWAGLGKSIEPLLRGDRAAIASDGWRREAVIGAASGGGDGQGPQTS